MKNLAWVGALAFSLWMAAPARAGVIPCGGGGGSTGGVSCPTTRSCTDDAVCFGMGLGRCLRSDGSSTGVCSPDCNPIFRCNSTSDCPTFDPLIATCRPTTIAGLPGICEYHDAMDRPFVTLCGAVGGSASLMDFRNCFSAAGHWSDGDCDGDGVPNGVDEAPCSAADTTMIAPVASPFCLGGQICEGTSPVCTPFIRCVAGSTECDAVAAQASTTGWECSALPPASTAFCHPSCNPTAHCGGTISCNGLGSCLSVDATLSMCVPPALASCASSCSAIDWASPQGDCDGDGAQNGCDTAPCAPGSSPCSYDHLCSIDAGVVASDAGTSAPDAFVSSDAGHDAAASQSDGGTSQSDAGASQSDAAQSDDAATFDGGRRPIDSGSTSIDGSPGIDAAGQGFGGGGGCHCSVAGTSTPAGRGLWLLGMLALIVRRRGSLVQITRR